MVIVSRWYQVASGATYVNVDMLENKKEGNRMLLIEGIHFDLAYLSQGISSFATFIRF